MNLSEQNNNWLTGKLRLTIFLHPEKQLPPTHNWWEDLVGTEPDTQTNMPKSGMHQSRGDFQYKNKKFALELTTKPDRVDWLLTPAKSSTEPEEVPALGSYIDLSSYFLELMIRWLKDARVSTYRMAFGAELLLVVDDVESGYRELSRYLHKVEIDAEGSSDLLYSINRKRDSKILPGTVINRLSKWSIVEVYKVLFIRDPNGIEIRQKGSIMNTVCSLEIDINTQESRKDEIPENKQVDIFNELIELGNEIAVKGDIP